MESRQSNKESALQRGGNEKGSPFVIRDVFSPFSLLITSEEFQVQVSHESLSRFLLLPPPPLSATPFPFVSVHLLARLLLGNFLLAVHPHLSLFLFSLRSDVIRFCGSQLNCTSGLLAILRERSTIQRGRKVRSDMDTSAGVYRIYAQNERESTRTHTYGCEKCLTPSRSYGDSL